MIVRLIIGALFALAVGAASGLGATYYALHRDIAFDSWNVGPWTMRREIGTAHADPYTRASIARIGRLPLALGDGVSFTAKTDITGKLLDGRCEAVIAGITPMARFWTLTLYTPSGDLVANAIDRHGFTSQEIVRRADGHFIMTVGPRAAPGNWLPSGGIARYVLVLRLYDTPIGVAATSNREIAMPTISMRNCP